MENDLTELPILVKINTKSFLLQRSFPKITMIRDFCLTFLALLFVLPYTIHGAATSGRHFVHNGGFMVENGARELHYREQELFVPASTLKILTCLVALEKLGNDFHFQTHFYLDKQNNLYIKGYGDPFLTSEAVLQISKELAQRGVDEIGFLYLDDSSFALNGETAGGENSTNPYDAPNGGLAVNFNALPVSVSGSRIIGSGEPETPLLPLMLEAGKNLPSGFHRININSLKQSGGLSPALRYVGELFSVQLKLAGITVQNGFQNRNVPQNLEPTYIYYGTKTLAEIIRKCLKYSNNYIANQLFLTSGVKEFGLPATWSKSRRTYRLFSKKVLGFTPRQINIQEGSGLSRTNRLSPEALVKILDRFKPYSNLLAKDRGVLVKSGTLKDVYCYAGFFPWRKTLVPFAVLLNQPQNTRDQLLDTLHSLYKQQASPLLQTK